MSRLTVLRADRAGGFTQVANACVRPGGRLSAQAVGVLAYLLSNVDGWEVSAERLERQFSNTLHTIKKTLQELEAAGHLERRRINTAAGMKHEWVVYEEPTGALATDGLPIDGETAGIKKTTSKKTNGKKTNEQGSSSLAALTPTSDFGSAEPNRHHLAALEQILANHNADDIDPRGWWKYVAVEHGARNPLAWTRSLANDGELDGFLRARMPLDPIELVAPIEDRHTRSAS